MNELDEFLDTIYGEQEGFAYSPVLDPDSKDFTQYFFEWPKNKQALINHINSKTDTKEVYISPGLFKSADAVKDTFKGASVVWTEFDGKIPATFGDAPEPTLRLQSSEPGHEHWYWKLDGFLGNIDMVENVTQRLAYALGADLSCWNANRVLRPPGTIHHESGNRVRVLSSTDRKVSVTDFIGLPNVPVKMLDEGDVRVIPNAAGVVAKYAWNAEDFEFFMTPEIEAGGENGGRSAALAKLGHISMEMGLNNAEALSLLMHADNRWGKYKSRPDRKRRLLGIVNYCRAKHPIEPVKPSIFKIYTYAEFMATQLKLEWVVPGLIHKSGLICVAGPAGVGKSQFSLRFMESMAKGKDFLNWEVPNPTKMLFVSMEMQHEEIRYFLDTMKFQPDDNLQDNFLMLPIGQSIRLGSKKSQTEIIKMLDEHGPTGIIMDSWGVALGTNLKDEEIIFQTLDFVHAIRKEYGAFVYFIHHPRKSGTSEQRRKPQGTDDLYGNQYFGAALTTAIHMWDEKKDGEAIELDCFKLRLTKNFDPLVITRTSDLNFKLGSIPDTLPSEEPKQRRRSDSTKAKQGIFGGDDWRSL